MGTINETINKTINVIIVDDDVYGSTVTTRLSLEKDSSIKIIETFPDEDKLYSYLDELELQNKEKPDVILVDMCFVNKRYAEGLHITKELIRRYDNKFKIIVYSGFYDEYYDDNAELIMRVIKAGAKSFISRNANEEDIRRAVIRVARGENLFFNEPILKIILRVCLDQLEDKKIIKPEQVLEDLIQKMKGEDKKIKKEKIIPLIKKFAQGLTDGEIDKEGFGKTTTIGNHQKFISKMLNCRNKREAIITRAVQEQLINLNDIEVAIEK